MNKSIEVVIFKAKAGVSDSQLQTAALAVTVILKEMSGFISREFGASEDGKYIDIVHWKDLTSAKAAAEKVMSIPKCGEFFGLIDQKKQMQFMHFNKVS
ncbi:MAG: hypothetical protein OEW68_14515 [Gammaproteobacteria bacterium]|nr:hypothetical protein [Gammaproteobacteria bacterium]MDH4316044.1 hypothetical protein [Gammaproteobacteria bacterium]MDH5213930.1 hypothetical protein [Gammaproteobacteria bacterium]